MVVLLVEPGPNCGETCIGRPPMDHFFQEATSARVRRPVTTLCQPDAVSVYHVDRNPCIGSRFRAMIETDSVLRGE